MKFFPSRTDAKAKQGPDLVADLDSLVNESFHFKLHGKIHTIDPVSTIEFFKFANALARVEGLKTAEKVTGNELIDSYYNLASSICHTITREDIERMTQQQAGAFLQLLMDVSMGRVDEKKKTKLN